MGASCPWSPIGVGLSWGSTLCSCPEGNVWGAGKKMELKWGLDKGMHRWEWEGEDGTVQGTVSALV